MAKKQTRIPFLAPHDVIWFSISVFVVSWFCNTFCHFKIMKLIELNIWRAHEKDIREVDLSNGDFS